MNPDHRNHHFLPIHVHHTNEAIKHLCELDLIETLSQNGAQSGWMVPKGECAHLFEAEQHVPPCHAIDGPHSPGNPFLFGMLLSAMNLQFCTSYMVLHYLAKYVASIDKAQRVTLKAKSGTGDLKADEEDGNNTKITGNKIEHERKQKKKGDSNFKLTGRPLCLAEMMMQILRCPMIMTMFNFEYTPTQEMSMRPILRMKPFIKNLQSRGEAPESARRPADLDASHIFPNHCARLHLKFGKERQFDKCQIITYKDCAFQPGSIDQITMFGLRCPEVG